MANTLTLTLRSCKKKKEEEEKKRIKNIQLDFVILYFFLKKGSDARDNNIAVEQEQLE